MSNKHTYYIITIGCQMNIADSERLAAFLEGEGWESLNHLSQAKAIGQAALVVINTCGVRQMAEDRVYGLVNTILAANRQSKIIITGCLSKRPDVEKRLRGRILAILPVNEMFQIPDLLKGLEFKPRFSLDEVRLKEGEKYLDVNPKYSREFTAYVPIGNGCNNFCSYCVVPYARGREVYRPARTIVAEVKKLLKAGYKEITLLAQNVNSYRYGVYDFPKLLAEVASLPGDFWVRFSSSHPKDLSAALIKVIATYPKICPHLHLAVQSGDDDILKAMNRKYTAAYYEKLIDRVRKARPEIVITTDVIVGFPGETKKQFNNTLKLFRRLKFGLAYIAQYSPRYGTVSAKMKDGVLPQEKKRREEALDALLKKEALKQTKKYIGTSVRVLIEGINKRGKYYGKTGTYQTILASSSKPASQSLIGSFANVKIETALPFALEGKLVD